MRLSESNPIIFRNTVTSDKVWQSFCYISVNIRHSAAFFRWYIPASSCLVVFSTCLHSTSITFRYHSAFSRTLKPTTKTQLTSRATKDMLCVSGSIQPPAYGRRTFVTSQHSAHVVIWEHWCAQSHGIFFKTLWEYFYVLLTVHLSISLHNDQLDAHLLYFTISQYNTTILYMFRALHMLILRRF